MRRGRTRVADEHVAARRRVVRGGEFQRPAALGFAQVACAEACGARNNFAQLTVDAHCTDGTGRPLCHRQP